MRVRREDGGERRAQVTQVYKNVHLCTASDTSMLLCIRFILGVNLQANLYQWRVWSERNIYWTAWCHVFTLSTVNLYHWRQIFYFVEIFIPSKLNWFLNPASYNSSWNACWGRRWWLTVTTHFQFDVSVTLTAGFGSCIAIQALSLSPHTGEFKCCNIPPHSHSQCSETLMLSDRLGRETAGHSCPMKT